MALWDNARKNKVNSKILFRTLSEKIGLGVVWTYLFGVGYAVCRSSLALLYRLFMKKFRSSRWSGRSKGCFGFSGVVGGCLSPDPIVLEVKGLPDLLGVGLWRRLQGKTLNLAGESWGVGSESSKRCWLLMIF